MFEKLLIADRGEIVTRIARTCERMGVATVAVHGEGEAEAAHVKACDEAVCVSTARFADIEAGGIVAAAKQSGADAIHPGCGPLRRDAGFARAVREAGLTLIGPSPETLDGSRDRSANQELARLAGVRALPAVAIDSSGTENVFELAREVGYPLLVTRSSAEDATLVESEDDLLAACESGSGAGIRMERWLDRPRLLTVLLVADARDPIALGDVERSLELSGRTLLAESPAPALTAPRADRKHVALRDAAVRIAKESGLRGAASAEFLLDADGRLYFTELRAGLPLEHALCEMCMGLDLVELQLLVAAGAQLPQAARRTPPAGHAVEARVYAEDPLSGAVSEPTTISALRWPMVAPGCLRIETDLAVGAISATDCDPLVARVISYGQTRHQAVLILDRVLAEAVLEPLTTNLAFLREILSDESFRTGHYDDAFAARMLGELRNRM